LKSESERDEENGDGSEGLVEKTMRLALSWYLWVLEEKDEMRRERKSSP